ncbi:Ger(x)C family spore germination protein [Paenibacillus sp. NPDC058071]|uniref:Ger(x)C family spore germination protein n=1 Tax=Paenibacillus sp. NPDC058071 TaxID=3346326 RepID=UPI0036D80C2D
MKAFIWKLAVVGVCTGILTGCWDKIEINQLAIASLVGTDIVPEKHEQVVYYQIVNPGALASQTSGNMKAPIYTYKVMGPSKGDLGLRSSDLLPRRLFTDHYQSHIITERYAREGLRPFLNYYEKQYDRRSSIYLFITDSPLADVMMTYTPLERLPGRVVRSFVQNVSKTTGWVGRKSRVKDLVENMETSMATVLPLISLTGSKPSTKTDRFEHINANQGNLTLSGGAVFKHDRMVGKLGLKQAGYYHLLKGDIDNFTESFSIGGHSITLWVTKINVRKSLSLVAGTPVWKVDLEMTVALMNNEQKTDLNMDNLAEIKNKFKEKIIENSTALFEESVEKKWDLFGLEDKIKYKRGKEWRALQQQEAWTRTRLDVSVKSLISDIGEIINPYKGKE